MGGREEFLRVRPSNGGLPVLTGRAARSATACVLAVLALATTTSAAVAGAASPSSARQTAVVTHPGAADSASPHGAVVRLTVARPAAEHRAATVAGVGDVAAHLRKSPVYVDPRASGQMSQAQADALAGRIESAGKPVFVAVLPETAEFPSQTVLQDLRSAVGITGVYAVQLGDGFNAGADPQVMSHQAVLNLLGQVRRSSVGDGSAELNAFVDQAVKQAHGHAPDSWPHSSGGSGHAGVVALVIVVLLAVLIGGFLLWRRKARASRERTELEQVRRVVDEDITAFGEELDRLDFSPAEPAADDTMRADYAHALEAYERAKSLLVTARGPADVRPVTEALEDGRFALAVLDARRRRVPLPERRPPCFFDPRHGPSVRDVEWTPPGGVPRQVPACAADAVHVEGGREPAYRTVTTVQGPQPYWDAGPLYSPWAGGYFGGGMLPGLLVGTMLGSTLGGPGYGWGGGDPAGGASPDQPAGGDYSGSDFDPGDFGGGFDGGGSSDSGGGFDGGGFS